MRRPAKPGSEPGAGAALQGYEDLRAAAGSVGAFRRGLGVIAAHGMAAWLTLWHDFAPAGPAPAPAIPVAGAPSAGTARHEMVGVLAAMALAHARAESQGVP